MRVNFDLKSLSRRLPKGKAGIGKDPRVVVRLVLGLLLAANIAAALILFKPWGASPEEMEQQLGQLRGQVRERTVSIERLRTLVAKAEKAREEGNAFMDEYFMGRRTASSTIITELKDNAKQAGIRQQDHTFAFEPIEGSDNLSMMTISGNYEGAYAELVEFINLLDRSPRFLILDTLTAAPERTAGMLNMNFKMNALVIHAQPEAEAEQQDPADSTESADPADRTAPADSTESADPAGTTTLADPAAALADPAADPLAGDQQPRSKEVDGP
jgi:type IV pilus assembly protein PilO